MNTKVNLIGVYRVDGQTDVHLIELDIIAKYTEIEICEFTQQLEGLDRLYWQTPWDEKYLNNLGTEIIGDFFEAPKNLTETTRLIFFLHIIDFDKPLLTPFGNLILKRPESMPSRLSTIIKYERPD